MRSNFPQRIENLSKQVAKIHHSFHFNTRYVKKKLIADKHYQQIADLCGKEKEVEDAFLSIIKALTFLEEMHQQVQ